MNFRQIDDIITGVWSIFLRRPYALKFFAVNSSQFIWSFSIIIMVLLVQTFLAPIETEIFRVTGNGAEFGEVSTLFQSIILVINWFVWPVITFVICNLMGLSHNYIRYVIVDNYSSIVTLTIISLPSILFQIGLPNNMAKTLIFGSSILMLFYKWRVIKTSLDTNGLNSSLLLFIDIAVTIIVAYFIRMLFS